METHAMDEGTRSRESREQRARPLTGRQLRGELIGSTCFVVAATTLALLGGVGGASLTTLAIFAGATAAASNIRFDVGAGFTVPTQAVFVPMLFAVPPALAPALFAVSLAIGMLPGVLSRRMAPGWLLTAAGNSWFAFGPAIVFLLANELTPDGRVAILFAALLAQFACDYVAAAVRDRLFEGRVDLTGLAVEAAPIYAVDVALSALGLVVAMAASAGFGEWPVLLIAPLFLLMRIFSRERQDRLEQLAELNDAYQGTALLLGDVVEADDSYTGEHSKSVVRLSLDVAAELGLDRIRMRNVEFGALLHDVGKIAIPNEIINKPGKLNDREWEVVRTHTVEGQRMLEKIGGVMVEVGHIVRASHEDWDGSGYPDGLAGEEIPIEARIVSACDAFNAMTTTRSYRRAMPLPDAIAELEACAGSQFDPAVVAALLRVVAAEEETSPGPEGAVETTAPAPPSALPAPVPAWRSGASSRELLSGLAQLAVRVGANVQPGQRVEVSGEIGHLETIRAIAEAAYEAGAELVDVRVVDPVTESIRIAAAPEESLSQVPRWEGGRVRELAELGGASILVVGPTYPGLFDRLDPRRVGLASDGPAAEWREAARRINWTIVPAPTEGWATSLRPQVPIDDAMNALWADVARVCRLDEVDPAAAWRQRIDVLRQSAARLTALDLTALRLRGPGTDLTIGLPEGVLWETAQMARPDGLSFVSNLPTEEIYTTPDPAQVEGRVRLTRPAIVGGRQVIGAELSFRAGRVVAVDGPPEVSALREFIARDEGTARLGEVALVDADSRVARLGQTFGEILLDENATSHIALGYGFPALIPTVARASANASDHHLDLMVGSADVETVGVDASGAEHLLLSGGQWTFAPDLSAAAAEIPS